MRRPHSTFVIAALMLVVPSTAHANFWLPSFVRCITAPGPYTLFIIPAIVTIPTLLVISAVETWIVKRRLKNRQLAGLFVTLFVVNGVTSALGLLTMPTGTELWPGLPLCFVLTVIVEALLLALMFVRHRPRLSAREVFAISLRMNAAIQPSKLSACLGRRR